MTSKSIIQIDSEKNEIKILGYIRKINEQNNNFVELHRDHTLAISSLMDELSELSKQNRNYSDSIYELTNKSKYLLDFRQNQAKSISDIKNISSKLCKNYKTQEELINKLNRDLTVTKREFYESIKNLKIVIMIMFIVYLFIFICQ